MINQLKDSAFNTVKCLKNKVHCSGSSEKDPVIKKTRADGIIAVIADWEINDKNVGITAQEIKKIIEGEWIDFEFVL